MMGLRIHALGSVCATLGILAAVAPAQARPAARPADAIVQFQAGVPAAQRDAAVHAAGGVVVRDLPVIRGLAVRLPGGAWTRLRETAGVRAVTPDVRMRPTAAVSRDRWGTWDAKSLSTSFVQST